MFRNISCLYVLRRYQIINNDHCLRGTSSKERSVVSMHGEKDLKIAHHAAADGVATRSGWMEVLILSDTHVFLGIPGNQFPRGLRHVSHTSFRRATQP